MSDQLIADAPVAEASIPVRSLRPLRPLRPRRRPERPRLVLATILNLMGLIANGIVILTASRLGRAIASRPHLALWPQRILGAVFGGLAVRLAFASRD